MWEAFKMDIVERFFNFETLKGVYMLPVGVVGLWLTFTAFNLVFQFAMAALFVYVIIEAVRKIGVNRIKKAMRESFLFEKREKFEAGEDVS